MTSEQKNELLAMVNESLHNRALVGDSWGYLDDETGEESEEQQDRNLKAFAADELAGYEKLDGRELLEAVLWLSSLDTLDDQASEEDFPDHEGDLKESYALARVILRLRKDC